VIPSPTHSEWDKGRGPEENVLANGSHYVVQWFSEEWCSAMEGGRSAGRVPVLGVCDPVWDHCVINPVCHLLSL